MESKLPAEARVGHVHLQVADLGRSIAFYSGVIGFEVKLRMPQAAFLAAGDYHHHIGLNTWESAGGTKPAQGTTGLYHTAFLLPTRKALAEVLMRVIAAGVALSGMADHGVSEAIYLDDPDGNGVELYWDRPQDEWPRDSQGQLRMGSDYLDLDELLAEAQR